MYAYAKVPLHFVSRSGEHFKLGLDWLLRMSKPRLYYQQRSMAASLVKACPALHKGYAPPLISMGGGMHMVLSVGAPHYS